MTLGQSSTDTRAIAEAVEHDFDEAQQLLATSHYEMALFRAVASFEWFIKHAFLKPYVEMVAIGFNGELAKLLMDSLRRRSGWKTDIPRLLRAFWDIDTRRMPGWQLFLGAWETRNAISHEGGRCNRHEAELGIQTCEALLKALLINRIDAPAAPPTPATSFHIRQER